MSHAAPTTLPPIAELNTASATVQDLATAVTLLFEPAPPLVERLFAKRPFSSYGQLIDETEALITDPAKAGFTEAEVLEIINAHPRIGAAKANLSALSLIEQGYKNKPEDAAQQAQQQQQQVSQEDEKTQADLKRLNQEYEAKYGFKFIVFVNGRPRSAIVPVMEERIRDSTVEQEKKTALLDMCHIARDRLKKLNVE
ncbi:hypothetical protein DFQ26_006816 [Actinomortierella ambigua]|nr:hypothetical protein DFQ26_006816 [Actinomortierella ambigua]